LQPRTDSPCNSPIAGVLLTNADIDHTFGLVLMRQRYVPLVVYATDATRSALNWIEIGLKPYCRIEWHSVDSSFCPLDGRLIFRAINLQNSVAFELRDEISGTTALVAPAVGQITKELQDALGASDLILFDGTFWSDDELEELRPSARRAREMNHLPINEDSLDFLRKSPAPRKILVHINNTNPILMPGSRQRRQIEEAGIEIAHDGLEIVL
jgi:pyrroloquinoline quinone biosynthesis protein B